MHRGPGFGFEHHDATPGVLADVAVCSRQSDDSGTDDGQVGLFRVRPTAVHPIEATGRPSKPAGPTPSTELVI